MAEVVNLRQFRKARARAEKEARAEENRIRHGRTKGEKLRDQSGAEKAERDLDGKQRDPD